MRKRAFAWLLSFAMLLSFIPNAALANEPDSQNSILEIEQREAENVSDAQDAQAKVAETAVAQDERRSAEDETLPSTRDEAKYETPDATQSVIPEEDNDNAVTDVLEQNADAHLAEDASVQGLTPTFADVQRGMLLGESVEIIASGECGANGDNVIWTLDADGALTISGTGAMADYAQNTVPWYEKRLQVKQVMIQSSVTTIGNWAFGLCTSLTSVTIPDSVTTIGGSAFSDCTALTSVTIPDSVTNIGDAAFNDCAALTSVTIPDSVTNIAEYAFAGCDALTSMTIPNSVTNIGDAAFGDCDALANIQVSAGNNSFSDMDGVLFNKDYTILILYPSGKDRAAYVIPDSVTIIRDGAFYGCAALTSVTIPDSVTSIRDRAFYGCAALTSVTIPDGVTTIRAFYGCAALTSVTIPDSVTSIRNSAFSSCAALTSVTIPDSVTSIENFAFYGCAALTSVMIPNSVTTIGIYAFSDCTALTSVTIPDSVTSIEPEAFYGCESLTSVTIPDSVTSIGSYAFFHCAALTDVYYTGSEAQWNAITVGINNDPLTSAAIHYNWGQSDIIASGECGANGDNVTWTLDADGVLTISGTGNMTNYTNSAYGGSDAKSPWVDKASQIKEVVIQSGVTNIGNYAFYDETSDWPSHDSGDVPNGYALENITIPESVTSIGDYAFKGCRALTSVTIPASAASIGVDAFANCSALTDIHVQNGNEAYQSIDGVLFDKQGTTIIRYPIGKTADSYTIPDGVSSIGNHAFEKCGALTSVTIPEGVTSIENGAFSNCTALTSVTIPNSVSNIGNEAFAECHVLTNMTLPEGITSIGRYAFASCQALTSVTIPGGVSSIEFSAFAYCTALESVTISEGITSIGYFAFENCRALTSVVIPESVTSIGNYAFENCSTLASVVISESVTSIGNYAFASCYALTSVTIPESVTSIEDSAFDGCSNLADVYYFGNEEEWNAITIGRYNTLLTSATIHYNWGQPEIIASGECGANGNNVIWTLDSDGVLTISGAGAMADYNSSNAIPWYDKRSQLKQVVVQSGVTSIGARAFYYCSGLVTATIPADITSIGAYAFYNCYRLTGVTMPEGVTSIGEYAFSYCSALTGVRIPNSVTSIGTYAFSNCSGLKNIHVSPDSTSFSEIDGVLFSKDCTVLLRYPAGKEEDSYTVPGNVTSIASNAFSDCRRLKNILLPEELHSIGGGAFYSCVLTDIIIPGSVTFIGNNAFGSCDYLKSITIPNSITAIGDYTFRNCNKLNNVYYIGTEQQWDSIAVGKDNEYLTSAAIHYNWGSLETIANGECGANIIWTLDNDGLLTISGTGALDNYAYNNFPWYDYRKQIRWLTVEGNITGIGEYSFYYCPKLSRVTIPQSVTDIGAYAFFACGLTDVYYAGSKSQWNQITVGNYNASFTSANIHYNGNTSPIPLPTQGGTRAGGSSSNGDEYDLYYSGLFVITGALSWGLRLDSDLKPLVTQAIVQPGATAVSSSTFSGFSNMTSVTLPSSVTNIGNYAFDKCSSLTDVYYPGNETQWKSIKIGTNNGSLTAAHIHYNWIGIGWDNIPSYSVSGGSLKYSEAGHILTYTGTPTNIVIPSEINGVQTTVIESGAFADCKSLISVFIPSTVTDLREDIFANCPASLKIYGVTGSATETYAAQNGLTFVPCDINAFSPAESSTIGGLSTVITVTMNGLLEFPLSVTADKANGSVEIPTSDTMKTSGGKTVHSMTLDLSALNSGLYQFRFFNEAYAVEKSVSYDVDRSAPSTPENFRVMPGNLKNTLAWDTAKEADVTSIRIYRTTDETAEPELLTSLSGRAAVTYTDNGLEDGVTHYYWLGFVDKFSQESEKAGPVAGTPTSDSEPPSIATVYPADGTTLTGSVNFRVTASDNQRVKSVAMEISTEVGESASWETLETVDTTGQAEFTLDSTRYNVDALYVRFLAEDTSGNTAYSKLTYTFPVDNTPPETVSSITGEASATSITLHWTYDAPSDFSHFTLEKRDGSGAYAKVGGNLTSLGAQINNLTPGTEYSFRVMAFDVHGNHSEYSEEYSFTTSADTDAPVITAMSPQPGRYNGSIPLLFTATDNDSIQSMTYQTSNDGLEWTDMTTITVASANKTAAVSYSLNTASFEEGVLYVRAVAADASGNVSDTSNNAPYTQYMVDRTAPAAPRALEGVSVSGAVYLTWLQGTEQDLNGYTVERAYEENGSYSALATAWKKLSYTDSGVAAGQTYYYRLRSQDTAGNASAYSEVVAVTVETVPDTEAPRIVSVSPSDGYTLGADTPIRVSVSDNRLVASLSVQYSADGENWSALDEIQVSAKNSVVTIPLTASDIGGDALFLRVSCIDGAELTSGTVNRAYSIDTTPPAAPVVTAEAAAMSVVLNWTSGNESDLAGFYLYRKAGGESGYSYLAQCGKNTTSYTDSKVIAERNYSYYVSAIDARSNQSPSAPTEAVKPLNIDVEPPVIRASGDTVGTVGIEMQFSAKNTTDNFGASGLSYAWNFGDGETSSLLEPRHTYQSAGSYTISLTVTDAAGNSSSGQIAVTIKEATEAAWLDVTV